MCASTRKLWESMTARTFSFGVTQSHCTPPIAITIIMPHWVIIYIVCELHLLPWPVVWRCETLLSTYKLCCCVVCVTLSAVYKKIFDADRHGCWSSLPFWLMPRLLRSHGNFVVARTRMRLADGADPAASIIPDSSRSFTGLWKLTSVINSATNSNSDSFLFQKNENNIRINYYWCWFSVDLMLSSTKLHAGSIVLCL